MEYRIFLGMWGWALGATNHLVYSMATFSGDVQYSQVMGQSPTPGLWGYDGYVMGLPPNHP